MSTSTSPASLPQRIAAVDAMLTDLRGQWMGARDRVASAEWMSKINAQLDERLRLMALRDSTSLAAA